MSPRERLTTSDRCPDLPTAAEHEHGLVEAVVALDERKLADLHGLLGKVEAHVRGQPAETTSRKIA